MVRIVLLLTLIGFGCARKTKTPADVLIVGLGAQPATLDPRYATDANGMRISGLIFESLVHPGEGFKPAPEAAVSWQHTPRVYTFKLRPDLRFHNGRLVTAEDIIFSFDYYRSDKSPFGSSLGIIKKVTAKEKSRQLSVRIELKHDSDKFLMSDLPAVKILPHQEITQSEENFSQKLIGTGPFQFEKIDLNEIRLSRFTAILPRLKFKIIRDDFTRFQKLMRGEVDMVINDIPQDKIADFKKQPDKFQVLIYPGLNMTYLLINFKDELLKQLPVRRALAQTLRREEIITYKLNGLAQPATSLLTPRNPYFNSQLKNPAFDLEAAQAVINSLPHDRRRLVLKTSNSPQAIDNGKVLANQIGESGLKIDLESYEWGTFYGDVKKGAFQLATMKWVSNVDPDIYRSAFHSQERPPGRNRGHYLNPRVDQLLNRGSTTENLTERKKVFFDVQKIIQADLAVIPLWYEDQVVIMNQSVVDFKPSLTSDFLPLAKVQKREL